MLLFFIKLRPLKIFFLQTRYELSNKALALLVSAGGVTQAEHEFVFAMHGFRRGDHVSQAAAEVIKQYNAVTNQFGSSNHKPIAEFAESDSGVQRLSAIGMVIVPRRVGYFDTPLQYRIKSKDGSYGGIELPVEMYHTWNDNWWEAETAPTVEPNTTVQVASVRRTSDRYGSIHNPDRVLGIAEHLKVGWNAIMAAFKFEEAYETFSNQEFLDRIGVARAAFLGRYPIETMAD